VAKKAGTQIIESLEAVAKTASEAGDCTIRYEEVQRLIALAKRVDKRDEQNRVQRKPAKKAAKR
jgi:hypothetical protein